MNKTAEIFSIIFYVIGALLIFGIIPVAFPNDGAEPDMILTSGLASGALFCFAIAVIIQMLGTIEYNTRKEKPQETEPQN